MLSYKTPPSRVTQQSRSVQIREWLARQKELASCFILIVIETDRLMIHTAAEGDWLASIDWSGNTITVTEAQNVGSPYKFRGFKSAFTFLDAFLLHQFTKVSETREESSALARCLRSPAEEFRDAAASRFAQQLIQRIRADRRY